MNSNDAHLRHAGRMHFSEHELTAALTGAAKSVVRAQRKDIRKGAVDIDTAWEEMDRLERFRLLDGIGDQVLPVLAELPEVEVAPGTRPSYTDRQVSEIVAGLAGDERGPAAAGGAGQGAHRTRAGGARQRPAATRSRRTVTRRLGASQFWVGAVLLVVTSLSTVVAATAAPPTCAGRAATLVLTGGEGTVFGTDGDDVIVGSSASDTIVAGDGNDFVCALGGSDQVSGGHGDDRVEGGDGNDVIDGGISLSALSGDPDGDDVYLGGRGNDQLSFQYVVRPLRIDASAGEVTGSGVDRTSSIHSYVGGRGDDVFVGTSGPDLFIGYQGRDTASTFDGNDRVYADGDVSAGDGNDYVGHYSADGTVRLGDGDDRCNCNGRILGGAGSDEFESGPESPAWIDGGVGSDVLHLRGDDQDTAVNNVVVDVEAGTVRLVAQTTETTFRFTRLHTVTTGRGDDILLGSSGRDTLNSGRGDDILRGRGGNDRLIGNRDADIAYGGPGRDACLTERAAGCESRR